MNQDFKVEFNYSWLAPAVDDYVKVILLLLILLKWILLLLLLLLLLRTSGMRSGRLSWSVRDCQRLRVSGVWPRVRTTNISSGLRLTS